MSDKPNMLSQLRDIGDRYIKRTLGDVQQLEQLVGAALEGAEDGWREVEQLAHKIHGSGAMFGFGAVSEAAGKIERLVATPFSDPKSSASELHSLLTQLRSATEDAARERGIDV